MVLEIKPTAKEVETAILRPSCLVRYPTRQLLSENLIAQFAQDFLEICVRVTLWDEVNPWLPKKVS
ncbi:MAG: hypothetical protein H0X25_15040 [Acidobacteriales bacterium]|nr:hypothetical protein [Terriglobales bacterium]